MRPSENKLIRYLHTQFPATIGHIPLATLVRNVFKEGCREGKRRAKRRSKL